MFNRKQVAEEVVGRLHRIKDSKAGEGRAQEVNRPEGRRDSSISDQARYWHNGVDLQI